MTYSQSHGMMTADRVRHLEYWLFRCSGQLGHLFQWDEVLTSSMNFKPPQKGFCRENTITRLLLRTLRLKYQTYVFWLIHKEATTPR